MHSRLQTTERDRLADGSPAPFNHEHFAAGRLRGSLTAGTTTSRGRSGVSPLAATGANTEASTGAGAAATGGGLSTEEEQRLKDSILGTGIIGGSAGTSGGVM